MRISPSPVPIPSADESSRVADLFYASVLSKRGYDKAGLDKAVAVFDALDAAESAYLTATGAAADSLRVRDQAARELAVWMSKFRRIAGVILRDQPEMRQKLGL